jgi:uncharacterized protein YegL
MNYTNLANSNHPALVIFLLDISGTMGSAMPGGETRLDVVKRSFQTIMVEMIQRSIRAETVRPRYRIAVIAYSDNVWDVLGGVLSVEKVSKNSKLDELKPLYKTDTAKGLRCVKALLEKEIQQMASKPDWGEYPAPLIVHLTDGRYSEDTDDPEPIAQQIRQIMTPDGNVLVENIYISDPGDGEFNFQGDYRQWTGFMPNSDIGSPYARKLLAMSSLMPDMYHQAMREEGYILQPGASMLFPGTQEEFIKMAFVMTASSSIVYEATSSPSARIQELPREG